MKYRCSRVVGQTSKELSVWFKVMSIRTHYFWLTRLAIVLSFLLLIKHPEIMTILQSATVMFQTDFSSPTQSTRMHHGKGLLSSNGNIQPYFNELVSVQSNWATTCCNFYPMKCSEIALNMILLAKHLHPHTYVHQRQVSFTMSCGALGEWHLWLRQLLSRMCSPW